MAATNPISNLTIDGATYDLDPDYLGGKEASGYLKRGIFYVEGSSTAAGTWLGSHADITEYFDGLTILYKINKAGATTTTLNINSLGAKTVYRQGTAKLTTHYPVNSVIILAYMADLNSGCWMVLGDYNSDSNTIPSVQCETAAATAAKVGSCTNHTLTAKSYVHVNIRYTNTAQSALTLNIDSAGAKPIYLNGSATSASNYNLTAGTYIAYYNGTNFYFRTDGKLTADITGAAGKVTNKMTVKLNGGTTEGTNLFTYDGSAAKTINITPTSIGAASTTALNDLASRVQALESIPAYTGAYQEV